jgi:hypothetical protein
VIVGALPVSAVDAYPMILAGFPTTTANGGTSLVTTAPAPTTALNPTVTPHMMVALAPILHPRRSVVAIIYEGSIRPDEDVILDIQTIPELNTTLDRNSVPDYHFIFN